MAMLWHRSHAESVLLERVSCFGDAQRWFLLSKHFATGLGLRAQRDDRAFIALLGLEVIFIMRPVGRQLY